MIVNSENIEFGYELISVLPHAYDLYLQGKLKGTVSGNDTAPFYYFSPSHTINKKERSWYNTEKVKTPNINIHRHTLDKKNWTPPPLKEYYANDELKFDKELLIICNRHNIEWNERPINFFNEETLKELFELLKDKYQVVYINIEGRPELYDNAKPIPLKDFDLLRSYPECINIHDLHKKHKYSFNELQLRLFANCSKYITMNGGHAILAAYFGGENIVMSKPGKPHAKEILPQVNSFYRWYNEFGGQRVMHVPDEKKLINKVKAVYLKEEPEINILVRTSGRKRYFEECIKSIQEQNYDNYNIWISIDNGDKYPISYPAYQIYINSKEIEDLKERNNDDGVVFHYNHYINILQNHVKNGLIMYLDDDDKLMDNNTFNKIASEYKKGNELIFWKAKVGVRTLPPDELWKQEPKLFNISGIGYAFDSKYKEFAWWRPFKRADYHCAKSLYNNIQNKGWIKEILASTQNGSHAGMRIDKPIINNTEIMRQYLEVEFVKNINGRKKGDKEKMSETKAKQFILLGYAKQVKKVIPKKETGKVIKKKLK
jgi:hypothetical protein